MRAFFTPWRGLGLVALILGLLGPLPVSAQDETATLTVISMSCPRGYSGPDYYETCQSPPMPDTHFSVIGPLEEVERVIGPDELNILDSGQTDASGTIVFGDLDPGEYEVLGGLPADFGGVASYCYPSADPETQIPARTTGTDQSYSSAPGPGAFSTFVSLEVGDETVCEVYAIGTPLTPPSPAPSADPSPATGTDAPAATEPVAPASGNDGSRAAIFAGDCGPGTFSDPVAVLTNVSPPDGDAQGASVAAPVETSLTTLDLPLDDLLADDHVLVVFDEDDDTVPLACGAIGGIVAGDGSLALGLPLVGESLYSGIATLTPDGDQTIATIALARNLSGAATTPAT